METISKGTLTDDQKKHFWKDTTVDSLGYLRVVATELYIGLIKTFSKHPLLQPGGGTADKEHDFSVASFQSSGRVDEDNFRVSKIYSRDNGEFIMHTVWKYREAGSKITVSEDFFNQRIDGVPAVLTLCVSDRTNDTLWKMTWWKTGIADELYVSDFTSRAGQPGPQAQEVVASAVGLENIHGK